MNLDITEEVRARRIAWADACDAYKQCFNSLHDTNGFCCLGVAEDLRIKSNPSVSWELFSESEFRYRPSDERNTSVLSAKARQQLGYESNSPIAGTLEDVFYLLRDDLTPDQILDFDEIRNRFEDNKTLLSFIDLNDSIGLTLAQIAKVIRAFHI